MSDAIAPVMYATIPTATYYPLTPNEVMVKGSLFEGFTVLIEDPDSRNLTDSLIGKLQERPHTVSELVESTGAVASYDALESLLEDLVDGGVLIRSSTDRGASEREAAWRRFVRFGVLPPNDLLMNVTVVADSDISEILEVANDWGIPTTQEHSSEVEFQAFQRGSETNEGADQRVVASRTATPLVHVSTTGGRTAQQTFNSEAARSGVPVLYVTVDGVETVLGPYVVPGETACYWEAERLLSRTVSDRPYMDVLDRARRHQWGAQPAEAGRAMFAVELAVAVLEVSLRGTSQFAGQVRHARATSLQSSVHQVMRLPRCPVCDPLTPQPRNALY